MLACLFFLRSRQRSLRFEPVLAFLEQGMKVMLADVETDALERAVKALPSVGADVQGVSCDVVILKDDQI